MPVWYFPDAPAGTEKFARAPMPLFEDARSKGDLLPDTNHDLTRMALRNMLAERVGLDPSNGVFWMPKAKEVIDRSRGSTSKTIAGWTLRTMAQHRLFPVEETDNTMALLAAIKMTNCSCSRGQRTCPLHGDNSAKIWR